MNKSSPKTSREEIVFARILIVIPEKIAEVLQDGNRSRGEFSFSMFLADDEFCPDFSRWFIDIFLQQGAGFLDAASGEQHHAKQGTVTRVGQPRTK